MANESTPPNVLDHPRLRWLMARLRTPGDETLGEGLFDEFAAALDTHLSLVEYALLPHADEALRQGEKLLYMDGHWYLKRGLAALRGMDRQAPSFRRRLDALCGRLDDQLMREATALLPLARALDLQAPKAA